MGKLERLLEIWNASVAKLRNVFNPIGRSMFYSKVFQKAYNFDRRDIRVSLPLLFVLALTIFLISVFYAEFQRSAGDVVSIGELGSYIAGAASPLLIIWLIYSIQIQAREMSSQRQIRIYTTAQSILHESRHLLNSELKQMISILGIEESDRTVFDLDELPYTLSESKEFIELGELSFDSNAVLYQSAQNYVKIYGQSELMLQKVDATGSVEVFLTKSRYEFIERKLRMVMLTSDSEIH